MAGTAVSLDDSSTRDVLTYARSTSLDEARDAYDWLQGQLVFNERENLLILSLASNYNSAFDFFQFFDGGSSVRFDQSALYFSTSAALDLTFDDDFYDIVTWTRPTVELFAEFDPVTVDADAIQAAMLLASGRTQLFAGQEENLLPDVILMAQYNAKFADSLFHDDYYADFKAWAARFPDIMAEVMANETRSATTVSGFWPTVAGVRPYLTPIQEYYEADAV